jgi:D-3-phosphoglycerate dehydrogenase
MIGYELLSKMPRNPVLVNTARKEIIDEEGLLKMFAERSDFRYAADIAPDCKNEIEEKYPGRFFFTPKKMGAQTAEANINAGIAAASQIVAFFQRGDTTYQVNK